MAWEQMSIYLRYRKQKWGEVFWKAGRSNIVGPPSLLMARAEIWPDRLVWSDHLCFHCHSDTIIIFFSRYIFIGESHNLSFRQVQYLRFCLHHSIVLLKNEARVDWVRHQWALINPFRPSVILVSCWRLNIWRLNYQIKSKNDVCAESPNIYLPMAVPSKYLKRRSRVSCP